MRFAFRSLRTAAAFSAVAASPAAAQLTPSTSVGNNQVAIGRYADDPTTFTTLAQSFVVPAVGCGATCYLQSFSLFLGDNSGGANTRFRAYVYNFATSAAGGAITGPALFTSAEFGVTDGMYDFLPFTFATTNLQLTRGNTYAFVLSGSGAFGTTADGTNAAASATADDEYAGGALYGATNGSDFSALGRSGAFSRIDGAPDMSFQARFTASATSTVPEPGSVALVGLGLTGVAAAVRRRRA